MFTLLNIIVNKYKQYFWSLEKQARKAGATMGKQNLIASRFWSTEPYLIKIGNHCQLTEGAKIFTHGGALAARDRCPDFDVIGKVELGDRVYVGSRSIIMPGVTIGDNVLITAGSVVTKSIPSIVVVAGNPAKYVCTLDWMGLLQRTLLLTLVQKLFPPRIKELFSLHNLMNSL